MWLSKKEKERYLHTRYNHFELLLGLTLLTAAFFVERELNKLETDEAKRKRLKLYRPSIKNGVTTWTMRDEPLTDEQVDALINVENA